MPSIGTYLFENQRVGLVQPRSRIWGYTRFRLQLPGLRLRKPRLGGGKLHARFDEGELEIGSLGHYASFLLYPMSPGEIKILGIN
jgi:hypothetical protein